MIVYILLPLLLVLLLAFFRKSLLQHGLRGLVAIALLSALASLGRLAFVALPSVQPASFLILLTGAMLGPGAGLSVGILTGILSSFLTSLTPFTVWQVFLWGIMGLTGACISSNRVPLAVLGAVWGIVFGVMMNVSYYTLGFAPFHWAALLSACVLSLPMDLAHAASNVVLAIAFPNTVKQFIRDRIIRSQ